MVILRRGTVLGLVALVIALVGFGLADRRARDDTETPAASTTVASTSSTTVGSTTTTATRRPNIVFVLADDFDSSLVQYMPNVNRLVREQGMAFENYFASSAVCCPSRVSMLRGQYPHNTTVLTNEDGFMKFHQLGLESSTIATWLQGAGYRTALLGKYLNGYLEPRGAGLYEYVPPGWSEWQVVGDGYRDVDYTMNRNGTLVNYGHAPSDALTDVLRTGATRFISDSVRAGQPFFLTVSTFAPHFPYSVLERHAASFANVTAPRPPSFNARGNGEPKWLAAQPPLTEADIATIDSKYRRRVQSVQGIDDLIGDVVDTLSSAGVLDDTYVVFGSDNGYHLGQHRLKPGKQTAFDSDIRVPLFVRGPGIAPGSTPALAVNVDLAPTFAAFAGVTTPGFVDGRSLVPLLKGAPPSTWRDAVLIEHEGPLALPGDPDYQPDDNPTRYVALRTARRLFVAYHSGEYEFYDYATDPHELDNRVSSLSATERDRWQRSLDAQRSCTASGCFAQTGL
jgi:arylsulfatase A-like enzyme